MSIRNSDPDLPSKIEGLEVREGLDGLTPARISTLYRRAPLLRPVGDPNKVWSMFENSSLVLTAWHRGHLAGIARVLTDGVLYSFLLDLAVEPDLQGLGVGRSLITEVLERCKGTDLVLRDSDISSGFYEYLGFKRVENAWVLKSKF
jgi:GNAT superfamily N-acetyltransferase